MKPLGIISDGQCPIEAVDQFHSRLAPLLSALTRTTYFRYFKVRVLNCRAFKAPEADNVHRSICIKSVLIGTTLGSVQMRAALLNLLIW